MTDTTAKIAESVSDVPTPITLPDQLTPIWFNRQTGQIIAQEYDDCAESPRTDYEGSDRLSTMVSFSTDTPGMDEVLDSDPVEWFADVLGLDNKDYFDEFNQVADEDQLQHGRDTIMIMQKLALKHHVYLFPILLFDHVVTHYYLNRGKGRHKQPVGLIYTTDDQLDLCGIKDHSLANVMELLSLEVRQYDDWASGYVYRLTVLDGATGELLDDCGNIYFDNAQPQQGPLNKQLLTRALEILDVKGSTERSNWVIYTPTAYAKYFTRNVSYQLVANPTAPTPEPESTDFAR